MARNPLRRGYGRLPFKCFFQSNNVLVLEHSKHSDFAHDSLLGDLIIVRLFEFLYTD
jgi:hypothetical protein